MTAHAHRPSKVMVNQTRAADKARLLKKLGRLPDDFMIQG
jgi:mRNA-degrading endonuclease toxin of MazEF toxin-antitoxin module